MKLHWRGVILNIRLWDRHLQIWTRGVRIIRAESGKNCFKLDEFFGWQ
jgi:hypothetical protein